MHPTVQTDMISQIKSPTIGRVEKSGIVMDQGDRCRNQADECHRLMLLSQSGAEATILTSLTRSWKMIANQTDRYVAIRKKEGAKP
jgi:hypothetical protein